MGISLTISHSITLSKTKLSVQYNTCLVNTGAISGTSKNRLYEELGLESLHHRCWYRKLKNTNDTPLMNIKDNFFENIFFPSTIIEWNKLDPAIGNSTSFNFFKGSRFKFIRPAPNIFFLCRNNKRIEYLTPLLVNLWPEIQTLISTTINTLRLCSLEAETTNYLILHCPHYEDAGYFFLASILSIKSSIPDQNDNNIVKVLLYGLESHDETQNANIFNATMDCFRCSNRFKEQLY